MVKQKRNYISERKKNFFVKTLMWVLVIGSIFGIGLFLTHKRANVWTILAAVLTIPLAQNITRYIAFRTFNDPKSEYCDVLEEIKGNIMIYHGAIIPEEKVTLYVDHVVLTGQAIYFLCSKEKDVKAAKQYLLQKLEAKGLRPSEIVIAEVATEKAYRNICYKISKEVCQGKSDLNEKSTIIEGILM